MPSGPRCAATCSQPRSQPSARLVLPRASMSRSRSIAARRAPGVAGVDSKTTSTMSSYTTRLKRSSASSRPMASSMASFAMASFGPDMEPERSSTIARLTGGRRRVAGRAGRRHGGDDEPLAVAAGVG